MSSIEPTPPYQPRTLGQILDRVWRLLRVNFKVLVGISLVPPAVFMGSLILVFATLMLPVLAHIPKNTSPAQNSQIGILFFCCMSAVVLLYIAVFAPSMAAGSLAAVQFDLGRPITLREAYAAAFRKYGRYVLLFLVISMIAMSPVIVGELLMIFPAVLLRHGSESQNPLYIVLLSLFMVVVFAGIVVSILIMLRLSLSFPSCIVESLPTIAAIKRSNKLTNGAKGRIFLVLLVVYAISYAAYVVCMFAGFIVFAILALVRQVAGAHLPQALTMAAFICAAAVMFSVMILYMAGTGAGYATALGIIYNDQRLRLDGQPVVPPTGAPV